MVAHPWLFKKGKSNRAQFASYFTMAIKNTISKELENKAQQTRDRITKNFIKFIAAQKWSNRTAVERFDPFITDESHISRIKNGSRPVPLEVLVILHEQYGVCLNSFIAGDLQPPMLSQEMEDAILGLATQIRQCRFDKADKQKRSCF